MPTSIHSPMTAAINSGVEATIEINGPIHECTKRYGERQGEAAIA